MQALESICVRYRFNREKEEPSHDLLWLRLAQMNANADIETLFHITNREQLFFGIFC